MNKVNLKDKLDSFSEHWSPKIVGELNGQHVKLAKFKGEFAWHKHDNEDELFYVLKGTLRMEFRDKSVIVNENEFIIVPKGIEHKPLADNEVSVMLFEPNTTINTGNNPGELTQKDLDKI